MNNAEYPLPGFMPPTKKNWLTTIISPEDGSLKLLVHVGKETDSVKYNIHLTGLKFGNIKDPSYETYGMHDDTSSQRPYQKLCSAAENIPSYEFINKSTSYDDDTIVPYVIYCGCPIKITELPNDSIDTTYYWTIELPVRALPIGDSYIEVLINNKIRKYTVQRPYFSIHSKFNLSDSYALYGKQDVEIEEKEWNKESISHIKINANKFISSYYTSEMEFIISIKNSGHEYTGVKEGYSIYFYIPSDELVDLSTIEWTIYAKNITRGDEQSIILLTTGKDTIV